MIFEAYFYSRGYIIFDNFPGATFILYTIWSPTHTTSFWNITIQWTSHDDLIEKICMKFCIPWFWKKSWKQGQKNLLIWFDRISFARAVFKRMKTFKLIWRPNARTNSLEKRILYISFNSICCSLSPFHREWPQLSTILTSFDVLFGKLFKSLTF